MTTEQLAKLIAERLVRQKSFLAPHQEYIEPLILHAIRDLNLVQADPIPEGVVPVMVYVSLVKDRDFVKGSACLVDSDTSEKDAASSVVNAVDTHRVCLEGYALPVSVQTVKAKAVKP